MASDSSADRRGVLGPFPILGIPVRFHFTFVLIVLLLIVAGLGQKASIWTDVIYIFALFGSVLLHELGHALVSRAYGIPTIEIVMLPIGGLAKLAR
ncbi:MAG: hypothetical protein MUC42_12090, partial [Bryobacter sp.]|nr:hypothetical protein [Bryobacter sp.]